ncbi:MAG: phenylacetate--CoA ligase family protein [Calditrichaeota bacterium]|nr:MAG: phenylacetate--CoA ligase family protein [Calditrichota bacterium]
MWREVYSRLYFHVLYPLSEIRVPRAGKSRRILRLLEKTQYWPAERLERFQLLALRRLLWHAYVNCPYYRHCFDEAGFHPEQLVSVEDLEALPTIDKEVLREHREEMAAANLRHRRRLSNTGGSTGKPVQFYIHSQLEKAWAAASAYRGYAWYGFRRGMPMVYFWSSPIDMKKPVNWKVRLHRKLAREYFLDAFRLDEQRMAELTALLKRLPAPFLKGYPSAIYHYALHLEARGVRPPALQAIFTTGETLLPLHRQKIEQVFAVPVADFYGQRETNALFFQCPVSGLYHVNSESVVAEVLPVDGAQDNCGELLITDLRNLAQPFIRYRTGDLVVPAPEPCPCRRPLPVFEKIVGRKNETILLRNGRLLIPTLFPHFFKDIVAVKQFQVHCVEGRLLEVRIVPAGRWSRAVARKIQQSLQPIAGQGVEIRVKKVKHIDPLPSGKTQYVSQVQ